MSDIIFDPEAGIVYYSGTAPPRFMRYPGDVGAHERGELLRKTYKQEAKIDHLTKALVEAESELEQINARSFWRRLFNG